MTFNVLSSPFRVSISVFPQVVQPGERCGTEAMAAAKRVWCSGSNDFDIVVVGSGSPHSPCLSLDALGTEAARVAALPKCLTN